MKATLSLVVLALAASQAMAVVPTPVKNCAKTVVVTANDTCVDFAARNGITTDQLYDWNLKLKRNVCDNLDVGAPICVAISGTGNVPATTTSGAGKPTTTSAHVTTSATGASSSSSVVPPGSSSSSGAQPSASNGPKTNGSKAADNAATGSFGSASSLTIVASAVVAVAASLVF